jgi:hypothetical protein
MTQSKTKYIELSEFNDWEGETWNFYIDLSVNSKYLALFHKLDDRFKNMELNNNSGFKVFEFNFNEITEDKFSEPEMDIDDEGNEYEINSYMDATNIIDTPLIVNKLEQLLEKNDDELFDGLYKGRFLEFFEN